MIEVDDEDNVEGKKEKKRRRREGIEIKKRKKLME